MAFLFQIYAVAVLALLPNAFRKIDAALKYASVESADGNFKLRWTLNNDKLFFNITCKTKGWCAVGFTTTEDGRNMVNYDMAVGGVASNNTLYLDVSSGVVCVVCMFYREGASRDFTQSSSLHNTRKTFSKISLSFLI